MKTVDYNDITNARDYRLFTRNYLYAGQTDMTDLIDCLDRHIGVKSAKYDSNTYTLYLTISHDNNRTQITHYYDMINNAFLDYINDGYMISMIEMNIKTNEDKKILDILNQLRIGTFPIDMLYNASLINQSESEDILTIIL